MTGTPDVLTVTLGMQTNSGSAQTAIDDNNRLATDTIAVIKGSGVADADLQTSQLTVNPTVPDDKNAITGYQVSNMVTAKLRNIGGAGAFIDAVGKAAGDAVRVQQLSFSIDNDSDLRAAARADAVRRAQAQAKQLADAAGVGLGPSTPSPRRLAPAQSPRGPDGSRCSCRGPDSGRQPGTHRRRPSRLSDSLKSPGWADGAARSRPGFSRSRSDFRPWSGAGRPLSGQDRPIRRGRRAGEQRAERGALAATSSRSSSGRTSTNPTSETAAPSSRPASTSIGKCAAM